MKSARCKISGAILMEGNFRGKDHPEGPMLTSSFAYIMEGREGFETCGKIDFISPKYYNAWPEDIKNRLNDLVEALENHFINDSGLFEGNEEVIHATIPTRPTEQREPEEF